MKVDYHPEAREEFLPAIDYSEKTFGTGESLRRDVDAIHKLLLQYPEMGEDEEGELRRYVLSNVPFSIIYTHDGEAIFILALMHNAREPAYWKERFE